MSMPTPSHKPYYPKPRRFAWWHLVLALILLALAGFVAYKLAHRPATQTQEVADNAVLTVEAIYPEIGVTLDTIDAQGEIIAQKLSQVSPKFSGTIDNVLVEEGDIVKQGQVLATLDNAQAEQSTQISEAEVYEAKIRLAKAQSDLERIKPLVEIDAISRQEADNYEVARAGAEAALAAATARQQSQHISLNNTKIVAPVGGIIQSKKAQVGMGASGEPLFTIVADGALDWQASLRPEVVQALQIGAPAWVQIGSQIVEGQVRRIGATTAQGREVQVRVALPQGAGYLGMYVRGKFAIGQIEAGAVPISALMNSDGKDYVWQIIKKDGKSVVKKTLVQVLERNSEKAVVRGLDATMQIVREGGAFLKENDVVRLGKASPKAAALAPNAPTQSHIPMQAPQASTPSTPVQAPTVQAPPVQAPPVEPFDHDTDTLNQDVQAPTQPSHNRAPSHTSANQPVPDTPTSAPDTPLDDEMMRALESSADGATP